MQLSRNMRSSCDITTVNRNMPSLLWEPIRRKLSSHSVSDQTAGTAAIMGEAAHLIPRAELIHDQSR